MQASGCINLGDAAHGERRMRDAGHRQTAFDALTNRTQARPKIHPGPMHRGGPGVSARFAHRKLPFIDAQNKGIPLESCADWSFAPHGSATSRRPTRGPASSQVPVLAQTNVLELESRPKSNSG